MTYEELKKMEDSLLIEYLNNEVKDRIFKINVSQMPKGKAKNFIVKLIRKYQENGLKNSR